MAEAHKTRSRRALSLSVAAMLLVAASFLMPDPWLERLGGLFGAARTSEPTAFSDVAAILDDALENGRAAPFPREEVEKLAPHVAVRRVLRAGPMTAEEVARATRIMREVLDDSALDVVSRARPRLVKACPRLQPDTVDDELHNFERQLTKMLAPKSGPGGPPAADCASCHSETRPLPDGRQFDAIGVYPHLGNHPALADGRNLPLLVESLELESLPKAPNAECTSCHVSHDAPGFGVGRETRIANQGLWANIVDSEPGVLHVEVKTKNTNAGHRAPAGYPKSAYVVVVEGFQGKRRLPLRFGSRLPEHLRTAERQAGIVFARHLVDSTGKVTTDYATAVDLLFDSRLESGRFAEDHFVFDRVGEEPTRAVVTLWFLPDYATWVGARAIRRADKS